MPAFDLQYSLCYGAHNVAEEGVDLVAPYFESFGREVPCAFGRSGLNFISTSLLNRP